MAYTTIDLPTDYFNTVTWTGDGSSSRNITGVGFQPDWVWVKCRNAAVSHAVYDSVRGASKLINTNTTSAEGTNPAVNAFISDGFTVNSDSYVNLSSNTYVGWNWLAGGTASSNTDGSITSSVSANTTAGFSIVSYTGTSSTATVGHGLGVTPSMIIVKNRSAAQNWIVYHQAIGNTGALYLNASNATDTASGWFNNTSPTSSVFTVGTYDAINGSSHNLIAYCFAEKKGFSKFGSYVGNGSTPNFIYTGFKPAMVIFKSTGADNWCIMDNKRDSFNVMDKRLFPHLSNAESTGVSNVVDFVSNGFCLRTSDSSFNLNGQSFIYLSFAENPFVTSTGIPTTAR
tara:strand:+ start:1389 stop:2417 length:1029 start_codon:yes stop_codon:yes gene_type:complete